MSVENLRSVMHIDPKEDVLYSIPDSDNHGDLLDPPTGQAHDKRTGGYGVHQRRIRAVSRP